jgi:hypothetical protein
MQVARLPASKVAARIVADALAPHEFKQPGS